MLPQAHVGRTKPTPRGAEASRRILLAQEKAMRQIVRYRRKQAPHIPMVNIYKKSMVSTRGRGNAQEVATAAPGRMITPLCSHAIAPSWNS